MKKTCSYCLVLALFLLMTTLASTSGADDPLDNLDGTEGWEDLDTSAVDESSAWKRWRIDLRRWEAARSRLETERAKMSRLRRDRGHENDGDELVEQPPNGEGEDLQARIDAARRTAQAGGEQRRDSSGQAIDDERPWSQK